MKNSTVIEKRIIFVLLIAKIATNLFSQSKVLLVSNWSKNFEGNAKNKGAICIEI